MRALILREDDPRPTVDGRTLTIRLATVGKMYTIGRQGRTMLRERIAPGALKGPLARPSGVLRWRHEGEKQGDSDSLSNIYGAMTRMWLDGDDVLSEFEVFPGEAGDKVLALARSTVTGASISAIVREARKGTDRDGPFTEILRISQINGASLTQDPAYENAAVVAIRDKRRHDTVTRERAANDAVRRMLGSL